MTVYKAQRTLGEEMDTDREYQTDVQMLIQRVERLEEFVYRVSKLLTAAGGLLQVAHIVREITVTGDDGDERTMGRDTPAGS